MSDLVYLDQGLFTIFLPESKAGEIAYKEIASNTDGTGKIFTIHLKSTLSQLRKAGYNVKKAKKSTKSDLATIFKEMDALGIS